MKVSYDRNARSHPVREGEVDESREDRSFAAFDKKGRQFGGRVYKFQREYVAAPADSTWGYCVAPGHYFGFRASATRGGRSYGAIQPEQLFTTAESRDAAAEKYFAGAEKRALKNKARVR